jgi:hypothetical protein
MSLNQILSLLLVFVGHRLTYCVTVKFIIDRLHVAVETRVRYVPLSLIVFMPYDELRRAGKLFIAETFGQSLQNS